MTTTLFQISWILVQKDPLKILTCWCSCVAGTSQSRNHVIAVMYKIYYEYQKGYLDKTCNWNQETKKDVQPQTVCDFKLAKNICKKNMKIKLMSREEIRLEAL